MAQSRKCLPHEHEELSKILQNQVFKKKCLQYRCWGGGAKSTSGTPWKTWPMKSMSSQWETLFPRNTLPQTSACMHPHVLPYTHIYTKTHNSFANKSLYSLDVLGWGRGRGMTGFCHLRGGRGLVLRGNRSVVSATDNLLGHRHSF